MPENLFSGMFNVARNRVTKRHAGWHTPRGKKGQRRMATAASTSASTGGGVTGL